MAKNVFFNKYDIFLSYPYEIQAKILELYDIFTNLYGLNVWCDLNLTKQTVSTNGLANAVNKTPTPNPKFSENISNSRLFMLAVHEPAYNYELCEKELNYAIQQKKRILCMVFTHKPIQDYGRLGLLIKNLPKIEFYKDNEILNKWSGSLFDKFIDLIELMMNKKINRTQSIAITGLGISVTALAPTKTNTKQQNKQIITRFNQIKSSKPLNIPAKRLSRMAYLNSKRRILFCDSEANQIIFTDSYGSFVSKQTSDQLQKPYVISCSRKNEIFIGDYEHENIFVFDNSFKFKRKFDDLKLTKPFDIACDCENNDLIFITLYEKNELLIVNSDTGELILTKAGIEKPSYIKVKNDKIFIISNEDTIFVLRKDTYDPIKQIKFDNWCFLRALYIDNKNNIITTAYEKSFPIAFLYLVDLNGDLLSKVYIHMKEIEDMLVFDDKKFFFNSETSSLCILEFE